MKFVRIHHHLLFILLIGASLLIACSGKENQFTLKGSFTNLKEGELYFYTLNGDHRQLDTITIREGKFAYEGTQEAPGYYLLLFPNMSEQAIFTEKGLDITLTADATHLKEMKIEGGKDNELMTAFRQQIKLLNGAKQIRPKAKAFIRLHPESQVSLYLFNKYYIQTEDTPFTDVEELLPLLMKAHPQDAELARVKRTITGLKKSGEGVKAIRFSLRDSKGETLTLEKYKGKYLLLSFWATWHQESLQQQKELKQELKGMDSKLSSLSISLDMQRYAWQNVLRYDSLPGNHVCDMNAWESKIVKDYHIMQLPTYLLINQQQQIVARETELNTIKERIHTLIK